MGAGRPLAGQRGFSALQHDFSRLAGNAEGRQPGEGLPDYAAAARDRHRAVRGGGYRLRHGHGPVALDRVALPAGVHHPAGGADGGDHSAPHLHVRHRAHLEGAGGDHARGAGHRDELLQGDPQHAAVAPADVPLVPGHAAAGGGEDRAAPRCRADLHRAAPGLGDGLHRHRDRRALNHAHWHRRPDYLQQLGGRLPEDVRRDCVERRSGSRLAPSARAPRAQMVSMIVEVKGVGTPYDNGVEALRDVNLSVPKGQLSSLLGPSGCGKTTLLKIIAGLIPRNKGDVLVNGKKVDGPGPERAFVFQDFALLPWADVLRNVAFGLELRGMEKAKREEVARRYIEEVGLKGFEHRHPAQLSGGMRQRVGLARALAVDADIILMDEPFSSVDEQTRRKFQEDLLDLLRHHQKTVIFVTHSIEEAAYLSDQIALLSPRPGTVSKIVRPAVDRTRSADEIRRDRNYLDTVDDIWRMLRQYV